MVQETKPVKVSAKTMRLLTHPCDSEYITNTCKGSCCSASDKKLRITVPQDQQKSLEETYGVTIKNNQLQARKGEYKCPFQMSDSLCEIHFTDNKPRPCWYSPFTLNKNDTLIVFNRMKLLKCYKDNNVKVPVYKAFSKSLAKVLGENEACRIINHLDNGGGDIIAQMPIQTYNDLHFRNDVLHNDSTPKPASAEGAEPDWEVIAQELMKYHLRDELAPIEKLTPNPDNPKIHPEGQITKLVNSLKKFGPVAPIIVDENYNIVAGHARYKAAKQLGLETFPVRIFNFDEDTATMYMLADNRLAEDAQWDKLKLPELINALEKRELDLDVLGFEPLDLDRMNLELRYGATPRQNESLIKSFIVPPFSVLDTTRDYWCTRKDAWLSLGMVDGAGRPENLVGSGMGDLGVGALQPTNIYNGVNTGTSYFDPVLAEITYRWFCPANGNVIDPFAGGITRGGVAGVLGHQYTGIDLSDTQIAANWDQWKLLENISITEDVSTTGAEGANANVEPVWKLGNASDIMTIAPGEYDLVFSCPPYFDLERYTENKEDLSNLGWPEFMLNYNDIINKCVGLLKDNRFAVWIIGDVRDKNGLYRDLVGVTITAFSNAGAKLYNDIIIRTAIATAPVRARRYFKNRKVVNIHQRMLVFYKGDPKKIAEEFGEVEVGEFTEDAEYTVED